MEEDPRVYQWIDVTLRGYECLECGHRFIKCYRFGAMEELRAKVFLSKDNIHSVKVPIDCPKCGSHEGKWICIDTKLYDEYFETEKQNESNWEDFFNLEF